MLKLLMFIAVPANLVALGALAYSFRGSSRGALLVLGLVGLLLAMATSSLTVISSIELSHAPDNESTTGSDEERAAYREHVAGEVGTLRTIGAVASLLPWIGALAALNRARRLET
jgi:hypothetical protein